MFFSCHSIWQALNYHFKTIIVGGNAFTHINWIKEKLFCKFTFKLWCSFCNISSFILWRNEDWHTGANLPCAYSKPSSPPSLSSVINVFFEKSVEYFSSEYENRYNHFPLTVRYRCQKITSNPERHWADPPSFELKTMWPYPHVWLRITQVCSNLQSCLQGAVVRIPSASLSPVRKSGYHLMRKISGILEIDLILNISSILGHRACSCTTSWAWTALLWLCKEPL